jgi:hypothetical protein
MWANSRRILVKLDLTSTNAKENNEIRRKSSLPCKHCGKKGHPPFSAPSVIKWGMKLLHVKIRINNIVTGQILLIKKRRRITCSLLHISLASNQVRID